MASGLTDKSDEVQLATFLYTMGVDAKQLYETFTFEQENQKAKFDIVSYNFLAYFTPKKNVIHLRSMFHARTQKPEESIETFIRELYRLSDHCEFGTGKDNTLRDRLVVGLIDKELSTKLQLQDDLDLNKA